jgi:hypothetical protein
MAARLMRLRWHASRLAETTANRILGKYVLGVIRFALHLIDRLDKELTDLLSTKNCRVSQAFHSGVIQTTYKVPISIPVIPFPGDARWAGYRGVILGMVTVAGIRGRERRGLDVHISVRAGLAAERSPALAGREAQELSDGYRHGRQN